MGQSIKHHYNPRGLLKAWSEGDAQRIWQLCFDSKKQQMITSNPSISDVAHHKHLYRIREKYRGDIFIVSAVEFLKIKHRVPSISFDIEETLMGEVDTRGVAALDQFRETGFVNFSGKMRDDFLRFLYALQARNPVIMEIIQKEALPAAVAEFERMPEHEKIRDLISFDAISQDMNAAKLTVIDNLLAANLAKELYDGIIAFVLTVDEDARRFVTASYPYVSMPDIASSEALHIFPLTPRKCLFMSKNPQIIAFFRGDCAHALVDIANFIVAAYSTQIFGCSEDDVSSVEKYLTIGRNDPEKARNILKELLMSAVLRG